MATSHMYLISILEDGAQASPFHNAPLEILISQSSFSISIVIIFNIIWYYIIFLSFKYTSVTVCFIKNFSFKNYSLLFKCYSKVIAPLLKYRKASFHGFIVHCQYYYPRVLPFLLDMRGRRGRKGASQRGWIHDSVVLVTALLLISSEWFSLGRDIVLGNQEQVTAYLPLCCSVLRGWNKKIMIVARETKAESIKAMREKMSSIIQTEWQIHFHPPTIMHWDAYVFIRRVLLCAHKWFFLHK